MVMISESDIIRFLRRCGDSFVDVTDFLANSVSNSLQKSSAIQKISLTFARKDNSLRINRLVGLLEHWVTR